MYKILIEKKVCFLYSLHLGIIMVGIPFLNSFAALVIARCLQNICLGAYITADTSLVVFTMGPIKSRPFTFALHSLVGIGFLAGTFLVKPFLPDDEVSATNTNAKTICDATNELEKSAEDLKVVNDELLWGMAKIAWPFVISGAWCICSSLGFAILSELLSYLLLT